MTERALSAQMKPGRRIEARRENEKLILQAAEKPAQPKPWALAKKINTTLAGWKNTNATTPCTWPLRLHKRRKLRLP